MKLHWSPRSPFVRKVNIVLAECGLTDAVERMRSVAVFAAPPNPDILRDNPLGKIPVLITDDGRKLFDSRVICEYLIGLAGRDDLLPTDPETRFRHLRWQALGDGLTDIGYWTGSDWQFLRAEGTQQNALATDARSGAGTSFSFAAVASDLGAVASGNTGLIVAADFDGDARTDMEIELTGWHLLSVTDFIL